MNEPIGDMVSQPHLVIAAVRCMYVYLPGNKGAVAISFYFCGTSFCFINTHLTSGAERCNRYVLCMTYLYFHCHKTTFCLKKLGFWSFVYKVLLKWQIQIPISINFIQSQPVLLVIFFKQPHVYKGEYFVITKVK